jgi:glycosyltransferase involved in cell wall biosynthesis
LQEQTFQDWRWLVQVDGSAGDVESSLIACGAGDDPRVSLAANGTRVGTAITRNVALGRATAPLIQNLDADDELEPTALHTLSSALATHPDTGFAAGPARDLLLSGALIDVAIPFPPGPIPRGALLDAWTTSSRLPVHPAGIMWHRDLLITLGGWTAFHTMEDTGLLMAASATTSAVIVEQPVLRYRRHRAQTSTKTSSFEGGGEQITLIRDRARRLRRQPPWQPSPQLQDYPSPGDGER